MTCEELYERLTDLAEGSLQGDVCDQVQRHLDECRDCQLVRQDLEDLARLCREASTPSSMPDDVRRRIQAMLAPDDTGTPRPSA